MRGRYNINYFISVTRLRSESPKNQYNVYDSITKHSTSSIDRRENKTDSSDYYKSSYGSDVKEKIYDVTDSSYSTSKINKKEGFGTRYGSESPRNRTASPITSKHLGNGSRLEINRSSSPYRGGSPHRATSPVGRTTSPLTRKDSPLNRTASPINRFVEYLAAFNRHTTCIRMLISAPHKAKIPTQYKFPL